MSTARTLIALDEDIKTLREIEEFASDWFKVVTTRSADRALGLAQADASVAVLIANEILTNSSGLTVLKALQAARPDVRRVLVASPGGLSDIIEGLHCGAVNRVIYKPIRQHELASAVSLTNTAAQNARASA